MAIEDLYFARLDRTTPSFVRGRGRVEDLDLLVVLDGGRDISEHGLVRRHLDLDVGTGGALDLFDSRQDRRS